MKLDIEFFSKEIHFYTSGYPFLVSKLCKIIDEAIMDKETLIWEKEHLEKAVKQLLGESNTNFDSVIKNLENNKSIYDIVNSILVKGISIEYNLHNPDINLGIMYGLFKNENGKLKINNKIYELLIYDYMISKIQTKSTSGFENYNDKINFINEDGRMLFLAFLSPIINGTGFAFKEVKGGEEKRFDIVITYEQQMFILELKIWYGEEYHKKGKIQLGEYLEQYNMSEGYLLIFDFRKKSGLAGKIEEAVLSINEKEKKLIEVYC